jgi:hypothetical protein
MSSSTTNFEITKTPEQRQEERRQQWLTWEKGNDNGTKRLPPYAMEEFQEVDNYFRKKNGLHPKTL